jgi:uncharacterized small protein (DUF1192 family)
VKTIFFFLFGLLIFGACTNVNRAERIQKLDQITTSVDSLEKVISSNPSDSSFEMSERARDIELRFKQFYFADSVDRVLANKINDMKQARKTLGHLHNDCLNLLKGCTEMKESVRLLRYDIENADGDRKKYDEYIIHEQSKMNMLTRMGSNYITEREKAYTTYDLLFDELNTFSMDLLETYEKKKKRANKLIPNTK